MAVPAQEACQLELSVPAIAVGMHIHFLVFDHPPQPLHHNVVVATFSAGPAGPDLLGLQPGHEV